MDERMDVYTEGKTPHSTGLCPLSRPLPKKARIDGWADGWREKLQCSLFSFSQHHTIWAAVEQRRLKNEDVFTVCKHAPIFYLRLAKQSLDVRAWRLEPVSCSPGVITQGLEVGARGLGLKGRFCGSEAVARRPGLGGWGS